MLESTLKQYFGFDQFRPGQKQAISAVVEGHSVAAIFPTGSGKSLCYQLSALQLPHLTLVVSPLLALMKDQLAFLTEKNIPAATIDSAQSREDAAAVMQSVRQGQTKILMVSVERFKNERFRHFISEIPLSLLVVDEAHCISEWGHNFRPDYLQLPGYMQKFNIPQALLLTATATPAVIEDMQRKFNITPEHVVTTGFYRPNLHLAVEPVLKQNKDQALLFWLGKRPGQPAIVYVTLQQTAETVADVLQQNGINARAYHAGMDNDNRVHIQQAFMDGQIHCIVATIAFGMGIDKSDIRQVIHYDLPKSIENYSQEIGRAGRDGNPSQCVVLANADNLSVLENFVYGDTPELAGISEVLNDIKTHITDDGRWEVLITPLSNQSNIRQLPLKTLLVYLQIHGIIEPLYSYHAEHKFKLLVDEATLTGRFDGERGQFIQAILASAKKAKTWYTADFDALYQQYRGERDRAIRALDYCQSQQLIELQSKQITDVYRVLTPDFDIQNTAQGLHQYFKTKEQSEIDRIHNMLALFQSDQCLTRQLASYFGDQQLQQPCGHCSVCEGFVASLPTPNGPGDIDMAQLSQWYGELEQALGATPSLDLATRFLCGISVPIFTKIKARKLSGFNRLAEHRYEVVKAALDKI